MKELPEQLRMREVLEAKLQIAVGLLELACRVAQERLTASRRLREAHARGRCVGAEDLVRAAQALDDAHRAWRVAEDAGRICGRILDALRGDGLATVESEIISELDSERRKLDSADGDEPVAN